MLALLTAAALGAAHALPPPGLPATLRHRLETHYPAGPHPALAAGASAPFAPGTRVSPLQFGGDPTGAQDSAAALQACVQACVNFSATLDALGHFPGDASFGNGRYIANAGGCQIDLAGGEYKLSRPVLIPEYLGNMALGHGSLVADDTPGVFPADSFLLVVGVEGSCKVPQGSCGLDFQFPELFLDGRHVASGLQINNVMGTTVGPGGYFLNFTGFGLQINAGHEVLVDRCWLGETNFDYPFSPTDLPTAVAIQINVRGSGAARGAPLSLPYPTPTLTHTPLASAGQRPLRSQHHRLFLQGWPAGEWRRKLCVGGARVVSREPRPGLYRRGRHGLLHQRGPEPLLWLLH